MTSALGSGSCGFQPQDLRQPSTHKMQTPNDFLAKLKMIFYNKENNKLIFWGRNFPHSGICIK